MTSNNLEDIKLRNEEVQEILTDVPSWMVRWGNSLFLLLIIMLLLISWFIKYPDIISSEAIITTKIPPQKVYGKITGRIDTIFIEDNQVVKNNQPLAVIENTANYTDILLLKLVIDTIRIRKQSFTFPIDEMPILFLGDIETSYTLFENNYTQYILNKELQPFYNEAIANEISISELQRRLKNLQLQKILNKKELDFQKKELNRNKILFNENLISEQEYENKQLSYLVSERNFQNLSASISQINEAIGNSQKISKGTEINRIKEEKKLLRDVLQSFNQLKQSIKDWEMKYVLTSKLNGEVSFLNYWSKNQVVNQGDLVFTIIPSENSSYIVKLKTPGQNLGKVKIGQTVNVKIENYPDYEFGVLKGEIINISAISDKDGFYTIDVSLPEKLITSYNKEIIFKQEMRGTADIVTEKLRLIQRFFYQLQKIVKR